MNYIQYNFSHHQMTNPQPVPKQRSQNARNRKSLKFPKKFELPDKRGFELMYMRRAESPLYKLSMMPMVWNIPIAQPGLSVWLCSLPAPAHLLIR